MPKSIYNKRFLLLLAALCVAIIPPPGYGETLTLFSGEFEPYTSEKLADGGPLARHVMEVFAHAGLEVKIEFIPWARAEAFIDKGEVLGAFPYAITEARKAKYLFSLPIGKTSLGALVRTKLKPCEISAHFTHSQMVNSRILLMRGMYLTDEFSRKRVPFQSLNTLEQAVNMLLLDRGDILFEDTTALEKVIAQLPPEEQGRLSVFALDSIEGIVISQPFAIMFSPDFPSVHHYINKLNAVIEQLGEL